MAKAPLNIISQVALHVRPLRLVSQYIADRANGFQFGSYSLEDEVALAISFTNKSGGG